MNNDIAHKSAWIGSSIGAVLIGYREVADERVLNGIISPSQMSLLALLIGLAGVVSLYHLSQEMDL